MKGCDTFLMSIISDNTSLIQFCHRLSKSAYITVDTEFIREKTYWPKLCLVQLANESEAKAIDVLAEGINLDPLLELMTNSNVLKVFHAARQDLEIFFNLTKKVPYPFFDTQIAAMVCGFGDSVSYEALVRGILDTDMDKSSQFTDWSVRPLTSKQINYAIGDVTHLLPIYKWLTTKINANNRYEWLEEEIAKLSDKKLYLAVPEEAWRRIKTRKTTPRFLALLRELAAWRELEAQKRDLPRSRI